MKVPVIATSRLTLRPFVDGDAQDFADAIFSNPKVTLTLPHRPKTPEEELGCAKAYIYSYMSSWHVGGYGGWAVCSRTDEIAPTGTLLGFCGFTAGQRQGNMPELGFGYAESCWGKGVGSEIAKAAVEWFFLKGKLESFYACVDSFNTASVKLLTKLGMEYQGDEDLWDSVASGEGKLPVYSLDRNTYLSSLLVFC